MTKNRHLKLIDFATALVYNDSKIPPKRAEKIRMIREKYGRNIQQEEQEANQNLISMMPKETKQFFSRSSFVGTSAYLSPELLDHNISGPAGIIP
jgi:serine/threonine protein kinase